MEVRRNDRSTQKHPPNSAVKQNKLSKRADSPEAALKTHEQCRILVQMFQISREILFDKKKGLVSGA
jgi:hypothetical protein